MKSSEGTRTSGKSTITLWLHNRLYLILDLLNKIFLVFVFLFSNLSRFGFVFRNVFPLFVQFLPGNNHLAGVNAHMHSCAVRFLTWQPRDSFLCAHLHHSVHLLTFVASPKPPGLVVLAMGTKQSLYFRRSSGTRAGPLSPSRSAPGRTQSVSPCAGPRPGLSSLQLSTLHHLEANSVPLSGGYTQEALVNVETWGWRRAESLEDRCSVLVPEGPGCVLRQ